jgi:4-hydroxybenzoate polyprenyltransferase
MIAKVLRFVKVEHTAFSLPLVYTGAWMGADHRWPGGAVLALIVLAAVGARIFGMSFNRIFDRHIDARNPRTAMRELPSGTMGVGTALAVALGGLLLYLFACALLGPWCLALSPVPLIPLLGYSLLKRFTPLCHFGIGLCLALAPVGAFVAAAGHVDFTVPLILFSFFVFFWLSGADIIYALLDIESDRRNGVHSLPATLGAKGAQITAAGAHLAALACLLALLVKTDAGGYAMAGYAVTILLFILMYLPFVPVPKRFFPISTLAGIAGAVTPLLM